MSADEKNQEPDHTDAGQGRDIGAGYPEEQPDGANPGAANREATGDTGDAPDTSGNQDSDPAAATGNPGAAGGDG